MQLAIVAAVSDNGVIGKGGELPWHIPEDLKRFRKLTDGHVVLMGRKTYESIVKRLGKPLPNRTNVVITRQSDYPFPPEVKSFRGIEAALEALQNEPTIFVIGGGEIYRHLQDRVDLLHITHVHQTVEGDAFFPAIDPKVWEPSLTEHGEGWTYIRYQRGRRTVH